MNSFDGTLDRAALGELDGQFKRLVRTWTLFKRLRQSWEVKSAPQTLDLLGKSLRQVLDGWETQAGILASEAEQLHQFIGEASYAGQIEQALKRIGIPLQGEFPNYEFVPFKLTFNVEVGTIRLSIGRRSEQSKAFEPEAVAAWVGKLYRQVSQSRFEPTQLCRELLGAYELLSPRMTGTPWGQTVPLKGIYRVLTLRTSARQEYPESLFAYDLARLREQYEVRYEGHLFEFVPSRHQTENLVLVDRKGQESRIGSLVVYASKEE